jgi:hypothetical protein
MVGRPAAAFLTLAGNKWKGLSQEEKAAYSASFKSAAMDMPELSDVDEEIAAEARADEEEGLAPETPDAPGSENDFSGAYEPEMDTAVELWNVPEPEPEPRKEEAEPAVVTKVMFLDSLLHTSHYSR